MIKIFKERLPKIYDLISKSYHKTYLYKSRLKQFNKIRQDKTNFRIAKESILIKEIFNNQLVVQNGPFTGMNYINKASCSTLLPKLLGSYEESIHDWIYEIISEKKYKKIIDIGSAEGYYAVGFSIKLPETEVIAYDIDESARNNLKELMKINNIENIIINANCSHEDLNNMCESNTLVFCDIEGHEKTLLDLNKVPNLKLVDLIIESHDCFEPKITEKLIQRFCQTHIIKIAVDYPKRIKQYITPINYTDEQLMSLTDEERPNFMKFLYFKSLNEKN